MEDMAATVEAKELVHVQAMNNLERKLLIDKGNMQKVSTNTTIGILQPQHFLAETMKTNPNPKKRALTAELTVTTPRTYIEDFLS